MRLLRLIKQNPAWTQRQFAKALGVSLGKTNYCLMDLKERDWVKLSNHAQNPSKPLYMNLLTSEGIAQKLRLTVYFLKHKEAEHDQLQAEIRVLRQELDTYHRAPNPIANEP